MAADGNNSLVDAQVAKLRTILARHLPDDLAAWTMSQALWAQRATLPGATGPLRVGGDALMPAGAPWPRWRGQALSLVAVIDLAAVRARGVDLQLPAVDYVSLFYDLDNPLGVDQGWMAGHYVMASGPGAVLVPPPEPSVRRLDPMTFEVEPVITFPRFDEPVVAERCGLGSGDDPWMDPRLEAMRQVTFDWEEEGEAWAPSDEGQIGGWPDLYQNPIFDECPYGTPAALAGVRVVAPGARPAPWRQLAQFGWNTVLDPILGDTRLHFCFDESADPPLSITAVPWQSD